MCSMNIKDSNYICKADYIAIIKALEYYQYGKMNYSINGQNR